MERIIKRGKVTLHLHGYSLTRDDTEAGDDLEQRKATSLFSALAIGSERAKGNKRKYRPARDTFPKRLGRYRCRAKAGRIGG